MNNNIIKTIIFSAFFCVSFVCFSQNVNDTIHFDKKFGQFYQHDTKLKCGDLLDITYSNQDAYRIMWSARKYNIASKVFIITGAAGIAYMIVDFLRTSQINYYALGIGAGVALVSIPLNNEYKNRTKKAVAIYNNGLKKTSINNYKLNLGLSENGFGVKFNF